MKTIGDAAKQELQSAWERFLAERGLQAAGEVVVNSNNVELEDGSEGGSYLWLWYPAQVELLVQAYRKLLKAAGAKNMDIGVVEHVRGARITGTDLVMIYPTAEKDADRIQMVDNNNHKWANLRSLLDPVKRLAPKNRKVRYEVTYLEEPSPIPIQKHQHNGEPVPPQARWCGFFSSVAWSGWPVLTVCAGSGGTFSGPMFRSDALLPHFWSTPAP